MSKGLILLSPTSALNYYGPCDNVIHRPVVLEEEERDEDGKEESNGEVLVQRPHGGAVRIERKQDET